jgi:hypothetical protein
VQLGVRRGVTLALTVAQLRSGLELHLVRPGILAGTSSAERDALASDFGVASAHIATETDATEILRQATGSGRADRR